ncbi:hypothetical protein SDC9_113169 [bioreactor metagenome]|uniref:Uncharacterized protein n=1 Tax=bioreactor metagenome TaxID=1076179 RepID=A0A645BM56_9ZZZZ
MLFLSISLFSFWISFSLSLDSFLRAFTFEGSSSLLVFMAAHTSSVILTRSFKYSIAVLPVIASILLIPEAIPPSEIILNIPIFEVSSM